MVLALLAVAMAPGGPARASDDLAPVFGRCAGVYTAAREAAWLTGDPTSDALDRERDQVLGLLEAVSTEARAIEVMALRVEARAAHRALLQEAAFGLDRDRAAWSRARADRHLDQCRSLLLGS